MLGNPKGMLANAKEKVGNVKEMVGNAWKWLEMLRGRLDQGPPTLNSVDLGAKANIPKNTTHYGGNAMGFLKKHNWGWSSLCFVII